MVVANFNELVLGELEEVVVGECGEFGVEGVGVGVAGTLRQVQVGVVGALVAAGADAIGVACIADRKAAGKQVTGADTRCR